MGVEESALRAELDLYASAAKGETTDPFGKTVFPHGPINTEGTMYVMRVTPVRSPSALPSLSTLPTPSFLRPSNKPVLFHPPSGHTLHDGRPGDRQRYPCPGQGWGAHPWAVCGRGSHWRVKPPPSLSPSPLTCHQCAVARPPCAVLW